MTSYDRIERVLIEGTPAIHVWERTGPEMADRAWSAVADPAAMARLADALAIGAVGDMYVAYDPAYAVWIAPDGGAAPAPDGWDLDRGYMADAASERVDLALSPVPEVGGAPWASTPLTAGEPIDFLAWATDRGLAVAGDMAARAREIADAVWGEPGMPDPNIAPDRGMAAPLDRDIDALYGPM